jgi:hypothetical protein
LSKTITICKQISLLDQFKIRINCFLRKKIEKKISMIKKTLVNQVIEQLQDSKVTWLKQESPEKIEAKEKHGGQTQ